ncbi:manganese efflux pump [Anaerofilum sp. BX8]|uniref:Putative manganese efflux pump MntP n=1 Tax=Anaerofilum hominis TaxID=2763016 RepID=A0A923IF87_9FIRM|nr:manganese efflux pump MntP family protein [Anaerofilum hominis]MBC5581702.1 manganese efflux pump [Anaerofilum hominis]
MSLWDILLIGLGLSMDAVAVSISNALAYPCLSRPRRLAIPAAFGLFQGLMPVLGFFAGSLFASLISRYAGIVTLAILGVIGVGMIREGVHCGGAAGDCAGKELTFQVLLVQAVATSIDAFAVGVSFCAGGADILLAAPLIALVTFTCSLLALQVGSRFGEMLGHRAEVFGGIILILIGVKAIL